MRAEVVSVSTTLPFIEKQTKITSSQTRAKFYVAYTRAKHSVVFAVNGAFVATELYLADKVIPAY